MSATVEIGGVRSTFDLYKGAWDGPLGLLLNTLLDSDGFSGADPNPERSIALRAVQVFGGIVIETPETPPTDLNVVY